MKFLQTVGFVLLGTAIVWIVILALMWIFGFINIGGYLVPESKAISALQTQGFSNVKIVQRNCTFIGMRGGGSGDKVRFIAEATNPIGKKVTVYVFAGWPFKGATVRSP